MGIFGWLCGWMDGSDTAASSLHDDDFGTGSACDSTSLFSGDDFTVNPATGLPMMGGMGSVDVAGNPYGTDLQSDSGFSSCSTDAFGDSSFSGGSSSFDDSWSSSSFTDSGSSFSDW